MGREPGKVLWRHRNIQAKGTGASNKNQAKDCRDTGTSNKNQGKVCRDTEISNKNGVEPGVVDIAAKVLGAHDIISAAIGLMVSDAAETAAVKQPVD